MTKRPDVVDRAIAAAKTGNYLVFLNTMPDLSTGLCVGEEPDQWFSEEPEVVAFAREICSMCPVAEMCLQVALSDPELEGIWANTDETQRSEMAGERLYLINAESFEEGVRILGGVASALAAFYGVNVRTITRWKEVLRAQAIFTSHLGLAA